MPQPRSWCQFTAYADQDRAEVLIMDYIGGWGYRTADFVGDLRALGEVQRIDVMISSNGGDPLVAFAIAELMRAHAAKVVTHVVGLAASAASIIAMAGDEVLIGADSFLMIHDAAADMSFGGPYSSDDLKAAASALDRIQSQIVGFYSRKTGMDDAEVRQLMAEATYMTAEEAVAMKFADRIEEPAVKAAALDLSVLSNVPAALAGLAARGDTAQSDDEEVMTEKTQKAGADPAEKAEADPTMAAAQVDTATIEANAHAAGEAAAMARVNEVMELCALAGKPGEAAAFIAAGKSVADVRKALVEARAAGGEQIDTRQTTARNAGGSVNWTDAYKPFRAENARPLGNRM